MLLVRRLKLFTNMLNRHFTYKSLPVNGIKSKPFRISTWTSISSYHAFSWTKMCFSNLPAQVVLTHSLSKYRCMERLKVNRAHSCDCLQTAPLCLNRCRLKGKSFLYLSFCRIPREFFLRPLKLIFQY